MFLLKIFKGPLWILPRSLRIFRAKIFLPRSLRIFKDLHWSFANLTKIFEDLQRSLMTLYSSYPNLWGSSRILCWSCQDLEDPQFSCQDIWGFSKIFNKTLRIFRILCWCQFKIPYKDIKCLYPFYTYILYVILFLLLLYFFTIFLDYFKSFFYLFKSIILKQKIGKK